MKNYCTIDFETATSNRNSACSVGLVVVKDGEIIESYYRLIQPPENKYDSINVQIHGINAEMTKDAPTFDVVYQEILEKIKIVSDLPDFKFVAHNVPFDKSVLEKSANKISEFEWFCTLKAFKNTGLHRINQLSYLCKFYRIDLVHHNALSDALALVQLLDKLDEIKVK